MYGSLLVLLVLSGLLKTNFGVYRKYYYINARMSWPEAQSYCRAKHSDLATVDGMDDVNRLINIVDVEYNGSVWIGLKRGTEQRWGWSYGDDTIAEFTAWDAGNPTSGNECGYLNYGVWFSSTCSMQIYFACHSVSTGYISVSLWKNWTDAQSYCRERFTDLATIRNAEELKQIKSVVSPSSWLWIGLFKDSWEWSDKWSWFFRHWAAGQPSQSSGSGDCVGMSRNNSGKWFQEGCDLRRPFICHDWQNLPYYTYQFMNESMTWQDAQAYCRARFTDLATVDTMDDVNRLANAMDAGYSGLAWIGLHNRAEKRWIWSTGDGALSDSFWSPGEPDGDGECVRSFNGSWYDESCSTVLPFVCLSDSIGFAFANTSMAWRDAQSYCRQHHIDLASISSREQQNLMSTESSLWIGLFLDSWEWSDLWNLSFRYWAADQPSQGLGSGDCVGMSRNNLGKWSQYSCDLRQPFMCYGDDKLIKKQIVHIRLSCKDECTLDDTSLLTAFLNVLKSMGLDTANKISWRKSSDEEVFHQESNQPIH